VPGLPSVTNIPSRDKVETKVSEMIFTLLYGSERKRLAAAQLAALVAERNTLLARYAAEQARRNQMRNVMHELTIHSNVMATGHVLHVLPCESERLQYYVRVVMQIWDMALEYLVGTGPNGEVTRAKPNVETIALATLYFMQTGYRPHNIELLPFDEFLCVHLPRSSDLSALGFDKKDDTTGTRLLVEMFDNALAAKADLSRLLHCSQPPPSPSLTSNVKWFMPTSRRR
jgi:hypothetical protein